jgi:hypothetical protein
MSHCSTTQLKFNRSNQAEAAFKTPTEYSSRATNLICINCFILLPCRLTAAQQTVTASHPAGIAVQDSTAATHLSMPD